MTARLEILEKDNAEDAAWRMITITMTGLEFPKHLYAFTPKIPESYDELDHEYQRFTFTHQ